MGVVCADPASASEFDPFEAHPAPAAPAGAAAWVLTRSRLCSPSLGDIKQPADIATGTVAARSAADRPGTATPAGAWPMQCEGPCICLSASSPEHCSCCCGCCSGATCCCCCCWVCSAARLLLLPLLEAHLGGRPVAQLWAICPALSVRCSIGGLGDITRKAVPAGAGLCVPAAANGDRGLACCPKMGPLNVCRRACAVFAVGVRH